jgi:hypothetical protein
VGISTDFNGLTKLQFLVDAESTIYDHYPYGIFHALSKLGGLLAILKFSIILNILHKKWFEKEINKKFANNKIIPDLENN